MLILTIPVEGGAKMLTPIKKARLIKGIQQKELANAVGVSPVAVCKWETGKSTPNVKRLKKIAEVLDTTVESLIESPERRIV
jgi:transcriptional regulator with XRE-family HTH domain